MNLQSIGALAGAVTAFAFGLGITIGEAAQTATIDGVTVINLGTVDETAPLVAQPVATGSFVGQIEIGGPGTLPSNPGWDPYGPNDTAHEWWNIGAGEATFALSGASLSFIWGSPNYNDPFATNALTFYDGSTVIGVVRAYDLYQAFTGIDNGNHGGYLLRFTTPTAFTSVVAGTPASASDFEFAFANAVPEPATWGLMALGFGGLALFGLKRKRQPIAMTL